MARKIGDLSKGNKQKVDILAAIMGKFDMLIMDEPKKHTFFTEWILQAFITNLFLDRIDINFFALIYFNLGETR